MFGSVDPAAASPPASAQKPSRTPPHSDKFTRIKANPVFGFPHNSSHKQTGVCPFKQKFLGGT
jgi:hypothetical protein